MKHITVKDLLNACKEEVKKGNENKRILLSSDDEGNDYHEMLFLFTPVEEMPLEDYMIPRGANEKDFIVLG